MLVFVGAIESASIVVSVSGRQGHGAQAGRGTAYEQSVVAESGAHHDLVLEGGAGVDDIRVALGVATQQSHHDLVVASLTIDEVGTLACDDDVAAIAVTERHASLDTRTIDACVELESELVRDVQSVGLLGVVAVHVRLQRLAARDRDVLQGAQARPAEDDVVAGTTVDGIGSQAAVERVVADAALDHVVAAVAGDEVVVEPTDDRVDALRRDGVCAVVTEEDIGTLATVDGILAVTAEVVGGLLAVHLEGGFADRRGHACRQDREYGRQIEAPIGRGGRSDDAVTEDDVDTFAAVDVVVAGSTEDRVVALLPVDPVVVRPAVELVVAGAAVDVVAARAARDDIVTAAPRAAGCDRPCSGRSDSARRRRSGSRPSAPPSMKSEPPPPKTTSMPAAPMMVSMPSPSAFMMASAPITAPLLESRRPSSPNR